ncbi:TetR family transcriptional regulator [Rhodococcus erythropolis]|nr:TetR family transcriptional regulator [Rhodococcus erythropolis]
MSKNENVKDGPARRDPEGRRRRIEVAASELLMECGGGPITHRQVATRAGVALGSTTHYFATLEELREAALQRLIDQAERDICFIEESLERHGPSPKVLAAWIYDYHSDVGRVRRAVALYAAAAQNSDARRLASFWFNRLTEILSRYTDPERALQLAVFADGVTLHASMREQPLDLEVLVRAISALLGEPLGPTDKHA